MERHKERRRSISQVIFLLMPLATCLLSAANVEAAPKITGCASFCHGMPPKDGQRKGNPHFDSMSSSVRGNHQTHLPANPTANSCTACHGTFAAYTSVRHQNNIIEMSANIHTSPSAATYSRGTFFNQTSIPPLGSCSNVNCHFTASTDAWGTTPAYSTTGANTTTCGKCHGAPPATNNHSKHFQAFGANVSACAKCHTDHTAEAASFQHATSAGPNHRNLSVTFTGAPNGTGSYTAGSHIVYPNYITTATGYGSCSATYCHGSATPTWGGTPLVCNSCHGASNNGDLSAGATGHAIHYNSATVFSNMTGSNAHTSSAYVYGCKNCHPTGSHANGPATANRAAEVGGLKISAYTEAGTTVTDPKGMKYTPSGTCTTVCHTDGNGGVPKVAVNWGTARVGGSNCGFCHNKQGDASPTWSAPHTKHVNTYPFTCQNCHFGTASDNATINGASGRNQHPNGVKDVAFSYNAILRTTWSSTGTQCINTYCHSDGTNFSAPTHGTLSWTSPPTIICSSCHSGGTATGPTYTNGTPKANSHNKHVVALGNTCNNCHNSVTSNGTTITDVTKHVNQAYDLQQGGTYIATGAAVTFAATPGTSSSPSVCNNISCHGGTGTTATWGTTPNCQNCHGDTTDLDVFTLPFTNATSNPFKPSSPVAKVNMTEWTTTGHGKTSGTYASGNGAAAFAVANACEYCHDPAISHNTAANPFRLRGNTGGTSWGLNDACMNCHKTGASGVTVGGVLKNSSKTVGAVHNGSTHSVVHNFGGQFCWDCHDGHGDSNAYMIGKKVVKNSSFNSPDLPTAGVPTAFATPKDPIFTLSSNPPVGGDYVKADFTGICQVCHGSGISHYNTSSYDTTHNINTRCTLCHRHNGDGTDPNTGFDANGHSTAYPYPSHAGAASVSCYNATGCHTNTKATSYPTIGSVPDCQGCHTKAAPGIGCGSCHGDATGRPNGGFAGFPDNQGNHFSQGEHSSAPCSTCHFGGGTGTATHGNSSHVVKAKKDVIVVFDPAGQAKNMTFVQNPTTGNVTCSGSCTNGGGGHSNDNW